MIKLSTQFFTNCKYPHKAVTWESKDPPKDFHTMLHFYGVFLHNKRTHENIAIFTDYEKR